jgi:hypothetical protein
MELLGGSLVNGGEIGNHLHTSLFPFIRNKELNLR